MSLRRILLILPPLLCISACILTFVGQIRLGHAATDWTLDACAAQGELSARIVGGYGDGTGAYCSIGPREWDNPCRTDNRLAGFGFFQTPSGAFPRILAVEIPLWFPTLLSFLPLLRAWRKSRRKPAAFPITPTAETPTQRPHPKTKTKNPLSVNLCALCVPLCQTTPRRPQSRRGLFLPGPVDPQMRPKT